MTQEWTNGNREPAFGKLTYTEQVWPDLPKTLVISAQTLLAEVSGTQYRHECTKEEWRKLESLIKACNFPAWDEQYYQPVLDGTSWTLEVATPDGAVKKSAGSNGYPDEWKKFRSFLRYCNALLDL